ncbi:heme exporter protein CcmD [Microbulbifer sp. CAU 1566]|uniref:heme exporter protein CcmD n=1 Tax=unclassified Microbulbifer TaxID=2619833 RepID=UPI0013592EB9|nr:MULTISPECIES: heme exporter protein CcmD [unclassified Microbulbifer]MCK7597505.1 heme exporter protein CcmD [Microbulbifer sp. CAU 1566]
MQFQFDGLASFLAMNGHGPYVWASYGVAILVLGTLAVAPLLRQRKMRQEFARQLRQEEARRRAKASREQQPQPEPAG